MSHTIVFIAASTSSSHNSTPIAAMMSSLLGITRYVCRILCLAYSVLAFVSIPFTLRLMSEDTKMTNDTVIVPLKVCMPKDFDIESNHLAAYPYQWSTAPLNILVKALMY